MKPYRVTWSIELDAETPLKAAELALEIQRDASRDATPFGSTRSFKVYDGGVLVATVDLAPTRCQWWQGWLTPPPRPRPQPETQGSQARPKSESQKRS